MAQRSNASTTEPASTVAAFHSLFANALLAALISRRRFFLKSSGSIKLNSVVSGDGNWSGHLLSFTNEPDWTKTVIARDTTIIVVTELPLRKRTPDDTKTN